MFTRAARVAALLLFVHCHASPLQDELTYHPIPLRKNLGSKTPYSPFQEASSYADPPTGCAAVHLNLVLRHGARNPGADDIEALNDLAKRLVASEQLTEQYSWMDGWEFYATPDAENLLIPRGMEEHYLLAKRLRENYPEAFPPYDPNSYNIRQTFKSRTGQSALAFAFGAFEGEGVLGQSNYLPVAVTMDSNAEDAQLKFLDICENYNIQVDDNDTAYAEYSKFVAGPQVATVLHKMEQRLTNHANQSSVVLSTDDMFTAFTGCAYDVVINSSMVYWCTLFDEHDTEVINYAFDLEDNVQRGYAFDITPKSAMLLLRDVMSDMQNYVSGAALTQQWRFAHDSTILPFACLLGLFKDTQPLTSERIVYNRKFRTSLMIPFASNAAFVLYQCDEQWMVKFLWNEMEVILPGCEGAGPLGGLYCPWDTVYSLYQDIVEDWNYADVCGGTCECEWK